MHKIFKSLLYKTLTITSLFCIFQNSILSHGNNGNCSEECKELYCPENKKDENSDKKN